MAFGAVLGQSSGSNFSGPIIQVSAPTGSTVILTKGDTTLTPTEQSGAMWVCRPWEFGVYTVTATSGSKESSAFVEVSEVTLYTVDLASFADPVLNNNTWNVISRISSQGNAAAYWSIGDAKQIPINGTIGTVAYDNYQPWVYILGFNHNAALEGNNLIHFGCFRSQQAYSTTSGIALDDQYYGASALENLAFHMNTSTTNVGGWEASYMRQTLLDADATSVDTADTNSFLAALPEDLKTVLKQCTKYSDNVGGATNALENITATTDWCWLLAQYEVTGAATNLEGTKQKQYEYYFNGNSKIKYKQSNDSSLSNWWLRTPSYNASTSFGMIQTNGTPVGILATYGEGLAPGFCV